MLLIEIQQAAYRRCGYADAPATEVVTRMLQWINIWQQRLLARPGIEILRDSLATFVTVGGTFRYALPATVRRVQKIVDPVTPLTLRMEPLSWIRDEDPQLAAVGTPEVWAPVSWQLTTPPLAQLLIQLWPTPAGALTYTVDAHATAVDLVNSSDQPLLPYEYHWLLIEAACYEEWMRKADTRAGPARQDLETGFKEMRTWLSNPPDYQPTNLPSEVSRSRLGGMYPSW